VFLDITNTTAEEMTRYMVNRIVSEVGFPSNIRSVAVGLDEERGQTAWYEVKL
jgi:6-pyruvoyltetrahydropterin/6-carboxytetrahydropterin synthase